MSNSRDPDICEQSTALRNLSKSYEASRHAAKNDMNFKDVVKMIKYNASINVAHRY